MVKMMNDVKSVKDFEFLDILEKNHHIFKNELESFFQDKLVPKQVLKQVSTAKKSIKSDKSLWKVLGFRLHGKTALEFIEEHNLNINKFTTFLTKIIARYIFKNHFKETQKIIKTLYDKEECGIINVWYSIFEPGAKLGLHVNNDPYMYRAHLGVIVPDGDMGLKVKDDTVHWAEGKLFVFDPTNPHTAWNYSDRNRIVLIVDFFKPEGNRSELEKMERDQVAMLIKEDPMSFGMSGGYFDLDDAVIKQYGLPHIEEGV